MRRVIEIAAFLSVLAYADPAPATPPANPAAAPLCVECLQFRVGPARIVRGPSLTIADNHFTEIKLPTGGFRGFDAHSTTQAIDGRFPWDMGGIGRIVLTPGAAGTYDSCGQWLNHVEVTGPTMLGLIHAETACHYENNGQTHKSMSLATSTDFGLHWNQLGQIITGADPPTAGHESGEGDCTAVTGKDGFLQAYCIRSADRALITARAPLEHVGPGNWHKFYEGDWQEPGLGGRATKLANGSGVSVARWADNALVFTGWVTGGLGLSLSTDGTTLKPLREPLLPLDAAPAKTPTAVDRLLYPVILDARTGANQLSDAWNLVYAYWPAAEGREQKYLVFREVSVSVSRSPVAPQVGVALVRWYDDQKQVRWSTTAPVPGGYTTYRLETILGYTMSISPRAPSVVVEDCVNASGAKSDHMLAEKGFCEAHDYQWLRTVGWIYRDPQPETAPLYRCYDAQHHSHFASAASDCEKLGTAEKLLGYMLKGF